MANSRVPDKRQFWNKPAEVDPNDAMLLFHRCLGTRFKVVKGAPAAKINFASGDPAFNTFPPIIEAANRVLYDGKALQKYHGPIPEQKVLKKIIPFFREMGIKSPNGLDHENIALGLGVTNLYYVILKKLQEDCTKRYPHKEPVILMPSPTYGVYAIQPQQHGIEVKTMPLSAKNNWAIDPVKLKHTIEDIERSGKKKVVAFYNMNPHNPTGRVYSESELLPLCEIFKKKNVFVIDDIIYHGTEFDHKKICPIASIDGMFDRTITLYGLGKAFSAADLRAGIACGRREDVEYIYNLNYNNFLSVPVATQEAIAAALSMESYGKTQRETYFQQNAAEYQLQFNFLKALIKGADNIDLSDSDREKIHGLARNVLNMSGAESDRMIKEGILPEVDIINKPEAGYFAVLDFSKLQNKYFGTTRVDTVTKLAALFVDEAKALFLPGNLMMAGKSHPMIGRVSYALPPRALARGVLSMKNCIEKLKDHSTPGQELPLPIGTEALRRE